MFDITVFGATGTVFFLVSHVFRLYQSQRNHLSAGYTGKRIAKEIVLCGFNGCVVQ
jgi:hypothetical protein